MSLHAQLSPHARERYLAQRRTSTATSIIVSLLIVLLVGLVLAFLILELPGRKIDPIAIIGASNTPETPPEPPEITTFRKPTPAPGGATARVLISTNPTDTVVPRPALVPEETVPFGDGEALGLGIGDDEGPSGGHRGPIPLDIRKRCGKEERMQRLREAGGPPEVEEAVARTLRWLKRNQSQDGSWGTDKKVGMTGLAILAYLGHCETPLSEEFGESCLDAIVYLIDLGCKNHGKMATNFQDRHWPYEHALATYALAEALSFGNALAYTIPDHREVVQNAGQWIIDNQHRSGGWDYSYEESGARGGDLSITGWHIQALKACQAAQTEYRNLRDCVNRSLAYVEARQATHGGFGYTGTSPASGSEVFSLTGVGALSFQIWGKASHRAARKGVKYLQKIAPLDYQGTQSDLYAHYYQSQAMMQNGGEAWTAYNQTFAPQLLRAQQPDGTFSQPGGGNKVAAVGALFAQNTAEGIVYRNCLCALLLEVYYRYLPGTSK